MAFLSLLLSWVVRCCDKVADTLCEETDCGTWFCGFACLIHHEFTCFCKEDHHSQKRLWLWAFCFAHNCLSSKEPRGDEVLCYFCFTKWWKATYNLESKMWNKRNREAILSQNVIPLILMWFLCMIRLDGFSFSPLVLFVDEDLEWRESGRSSLAILRLVPGYWRMASPGSGLKVLWFHP